METFTSALNTILALSAIGLTVLGCLVLVAYFCERFRSGPFGAFFSGNAILVAFLVSLAGTIVSLIYSNVIGYPPCELCWYQRICLYPQVILMGLALIRKDRWINVYGLVLSTIGAAIGLYQHIGQLGLTALPCSAQVGSVSCAIRYVYEFGVTIPYMSFAAFFFMAAVLLLSTKKGNSGDVEAATA
ncbi:MAG: disulfide bond formation protein B [Patescibacteria group bacterium]|nr:disulfide bond formation protein B [Patescibacteria group bacterium]MDE2116603.1 disulfide bond formation protein B [Patescibacteria group bacterium]